MLLYKSNPKCYANLVADIENQYTQGQDGYPSTLSAAYDMLINYRSTSSTAHLHGQDSGMAFAHAMDDDVNPDIRHNEGGQRVGGRSGGQGCHSGRGCGRGRGG